MLPLRARKDLGAMAIKLYSTFRKAPGLLDLHHQIVLCHYQDTRFGESYPSAEKQSVYSTTLEKRATNDKVRDNIHHWEVRQRHYCSTKIKVKVSKVGDLG